MLSFEKKSLKTWVMNKDDVQVFTLNLIASSVTNKFNIITDFITNMSTTFGEGFDDWYINLLVSYQNTKDFKIIMDNIDQLKEFVNVYNDSQKIDFEQFINRKKVRKGTILFEPYEMEKIAKSSGYLKLYSLISNNQDLQLNRKFHKEVYNKILEDIVSSEIVYKIFNVIRTKVYRYNLTDRYMWEYIKMIQCKSIDIHTVEIFNFIMNSIIILCEEGKNPISYFVGVVDESVKWFLRSVYKKTIIYDDSISTEDIHGHNIDNLRAYSYNDTLGRLKGIAYEKIYRELEKSSSLLIKDGTEDSDKNITEFQRRVLDIEYISPLCSCLVNPLLSQITNIPYTHFSTLSPEHSSVLSVYIQTILRKVFKGEYQDLFKLLNYYPTSQPAMATTYRIKQVNNEGGYLDIQNTISNFFGFKTKVLPYKIMSYFVGRSSRVNFCNIFDGQKLGGIPLSKIESDIVKFFSLFFSGRLDDKINEMKNYMYADF